MNQTTVGRVLTWLADATGRDAACDREKLIELMNDIRQLAYSNQQILEHAKPAYICVPVQRFCPECQPGYCGATGMVGFTGITLPSWMLQPTLVFQQGRSLPYVTRWSSYALDPNNQPEPFSFQDMGDQYVLEKDPDCHGPFVLEMMATKCKAGQKVTITYEDQSGARRTEDVELKAGTWVKVSHGITHILPGSVRLPLDLQSPVLVRSEGQILAQWEPGIDVPAFRRVKIPACHGFGSVAVKGIRRFSRLWDSNDIVEHDHRMAWKAGADFVMSVASSKMDESEVGNAMFKRNLFDGFIASEAESEDIGHRRKVRIATNFNAVSPLGM